MKTVYKLCIALALVVGLCNYSMAQTSLGSSRSLMTSLKKTSGNSTSRTSGTIVSLKVSGLETFNGKVNFKQSSDNSEFVVGEIDGVPGSSFFIKATPNSVEGHIIIRSKKEAYKYFSNSSGNAFIEKVDINTLICIDYENKPAKNQKTEAEAREAATVSPALLDLQSLPGAPGCVLLDFDGYYMPAGNYWNNGNEINAAPSGMSDADVQQHFDVVAEDYRPFNVNITTSESVFNSYPRNRRMRVVVTPTNTAAPGAGGVAYIGSFNWDNDVPCWVFITSGKAGGDASSHEIGHCFDLQHDGRSNPDEGYFLGIDGTAWAPIMGAGYYRPVVQWSKGEYRYAKNDQPGVLQDDIATIAGSKFGVGFRPDEYSDGISGAANLDYNSSGAINQKFGVISSEADYDFFTFTTGGGNVIINANTVSRDGDLHVLIRLYNDAGALLGTYWNSDPFALNASMNVNLAAGRYYVGIDGTGAGDPAYGGYSAYGSLGSYWVTGTIPPGGTVQPSTGLVTTYKDINYTGFSGGFSVGDYNLAALRALGVEDNSITAVKVSEGYKIILYFDDNFTGQSLEITSDNPYVGSFNDQVTSLKVRPNGNPNLANIYYVKNGMSGLYMDVWGAATNDGAGIMQGVYNGNTNQQFKFVHLGDGAYRVISVNSGKVMDISGISQAEGALVVQWSDAGGQNQTFIAVTAPNGLTKLIAEHSGKVVEVSTNNNGEQLHQWWNAGQANSTWQLIPAAAPVGTGDGLSGNYFNGMNFEALKLSRKDATLTMDWGNGSPGAGVNADQFSARWTGQVQPRYTGEYTFYITSDNGRRVWVNNVLLIDQWVDNWDVEYSGKITLTGGQKYDIKIEYFENNGGANIKLDWSSVQVARETIPTSQLYANPLPTVSVSSSATTATAPANLTLSATTSDGDGITKVDFYNGSTLIGTDNTSPYSIAWNNLATGTYSVTALATDAKGGVTLSSAVSIQVNPGINTAPSVSITAPANNASYNTPANITFTANATDSDGSVTKVEYFNGATLIGTATVSPYSATWNNVGAGAYSITAKATDNQGAVSTSAAITVIVNATVNNAPTVSITAPANNATYTAAANITFTATATDSDGSVTKVEYYNGANLIGTSSTSPYGVNWNGVVAGTYTITAKATDNNGATTTSSAITVKVNAPVNNAPIVSITAPANNASYNAPANITFTANATDNDGSIAKVEYFNGSASIGSSTSSPYTVNWNNIGAGTYTITAKATDNLGAVTTSSAITVKVNPVVTNPCTGVAQYVDGGTAGYGPGSIVQNAGNRYQCRPWPNSGWCNGAGWAYGPGTGMYWTDAWTLIGSCTARMSAAQTANLISPNPTSGAIHLNLETSSTVSVYNTYGAEVIPAKEIATDGELDLSALPTGMYLLKIDTGSEVLTQTVIKK